MFKFFSNIRRYQKFKLRNIVVSLFLLLLIPIYSGFAFFYNYSPGLKFFSHIDINNQALIYKIKLNKRDLNLSDVLIENNIINWRNGYVAVKDLSGNIVYIESFPHGSGGHGSFFVDGSVWDFVYIRVPLSEYFSNDLNKYFDFSGIDSNYESFYIRDLLTLDKYFLRIPTFIFLKSIDILAFKAKGYHYLVVHIIFFMLLLLASNNLFKLICLIGITCFFKSLSYSGIVFLIIYILVGHFAQKRLFTNFQSRSGNFH